jgi:hypothetical protein
VSRPQFVLLLFVGCAVVAALCSLALWRTVASPSTTTEAGASENRERSPRDLPDSAEVSRLPYPVETPERERQPMVEAGPEEATSSLAEMRSILDQRRGLSDTESPWGALAGLCMRLRTLLSEDEERILHDLRQLSPEELELLGQVLHDNLGQYQTGIWGRKGDYYDYSKWPPALKDFMLDAVRGVLGEERRLAVLPFLRRCHTCPGAFYEYAVALLGSSPDESVVDDATMLLSYAPPELMTSVQGEKILADASPLVASEGLPLKARRNLARLLGRHAGAQGIATGVALLESSLLLEQKLGIVLLASVPLGTLAACEDRLLQRIVDGTLSTYPSVGISDQQATLQIILETGRSDLAAPALRVLAGIETDERRRSRFEDVGAKIEQGQKPESLVASALDPALW